MGCRGLIRSLPMADSALRTCAGQVFLQDAGDPGFVGHVGGGACADAVGQSVGESLPLTAIFVNDRPMLARPAL